MKQRVGLVVTIVLVAMVCLWISASGRGEPQQGRTEQPAAAKPFLEVGKTYTFVFDGPQNSQTGEVVAEPRDNWVKVTGKGQGRDGAVLWVNLSQVRLTELIVAK